MLEVERAALTLGELEFTFDLKLDAGECVAVVGPSGGGKSTLLALVAGFLTPAAGRILVGGQDVTAWPPAARPVTMVFQDHNLFAHLSVDANVGLGIHPGLKLGDGDRERVAAALDRVGLGAFGERLPAGLSGGERQRVALARALVRRRPLLLLDEPFAGLGPALRREMLDLVSEIRESENLTVLLVSHHPGDALIAAGRTAFVHGGRILACGPSGDLLRRPPLPALADYLGSPPP